MESLLSALPLVEVTGSEETKVAHGNPIRAESGAGLARIFNKRGEFVAVAFLENGWARPKLVLTSINSVSNNMLGCILEKENEA
jgi:hypothetical protein